MSEADPPMQLSHAELQDLLDRFGSDTANWPGPSVPAAERLLTGSPPAARELDAARVLDGWLGGLREHRAPPGLAAAILAGIEQPNRADLLEQFLGWLTARLWRPLLVGALPVIAGFAIGLALPAQTDPEFADQIGALAFIDIYAELNDAAQP